jgi:hypothetical protein
LDPVRLPFISPMIGFFERSTLLFGNPDLAIESDTGMTAPASAKAERPQGIVGGSHRWSGQALRK